MYYYLVRTSLVNSSPRLETLQGLCWCLYPLAPQVDFLGRYLCVGASQVSLLHVYASEMKNFNFRSLLFQIIKVNLKIRYEPWLVWLGWSVVMCTEGSQARLLVRAHTQTVDSVPSPWSGNVWEAADGRSSLTSMFLSLSLPPFLSKIN